MGRKQGCLLRCLHSSGPAPGQGNGCACVDTCEEMLRGRKAWLHVNFPELGETGGTTDHPGRMEPCLRQSGCNQGKCNRMQSNTAQDKAPELGSTGSG